MEGNVELTVTRVIMYGTPGSGKTCAQHLLLDEDPPCGTNSNPSYSMHHVNDSTPAACRAVKATRVSIDKKKWKRISEFDLRTKLVGSLKAKVEPLAGNQEEEQQQGSGPNDASENVLQSIEPETSEDDDGDHDDDDAIDLEIAELIPQSNNAQLSEKWLYIIDSGGQPAYQELLPLFTRAASLNIITIDLSKPLDEKFQFTYRINGKDFPCHFKSTQLASFQSAISSGENFKQLNIPSTFVERKPKRSMHLILGTHFDVVKHDLAVVSQLQDTLFSNSLLKSYLQNCVIYRENGNSKNDDSKIFPVNTLDKEKRAEYSEEICKAIYCLGNDASLTIKLPLRWFAFELALPKKNFIAMKNVFSIGKKYQMSKEDTKVALRYLHDVTLISYYPEVLDVVFPDPQPILDILSHLLALTYVGFNTDAWEAILSPPQLSPEVLSNLKDGFFNEDLLRILKSGINFFGPGFESSDLITLLKHLKIIIQVENERKGDYFIPYALPSYDSVPPCNGAKRLCLLYWMKEKSQILPVPPGVFPQTIIHLLDQKEYTIEISKEDKNYRDAMVLWIYIDGASKLHIINCYSFIEIAFDGPDEEKCPIVRKIVTKAMNDSSCFLNDDMRNRLHPAFFVPDSKCHYVVTDESKKEYRVEPPCSRQLDESYWHCWFGKSSTSSGTFHCWLLLCTFTNYVSFIICFTFCFQ